jgi:hypothetical protein
MLLSGRSSLHQSSCFRLPVASCPGFSAELHLSSPTASCLPTEFMMQYLSRKNGLHVYNEPILQRCCSHLYLPFLQHPDWLSLKRRPGKLAHGIESTAASNAIARKRRRSSPRRPQMLSAIDLIHASTCCCRSTGLRRMRPVRGSRKPQDPVAPVPRRTPHPASATTRAQVSESIKRNHLDWDRRARRRPLR